MRIKSGMRAACSVIAAAVAMLAMSPDLSAQGLMVTGYADFEATVSNVGADAGSNFFFDNHHFNVVVLGNVAGDLFAAAEVEYEHAGEEIGLEYGYLTYRGAENFRVSAGKFIVPFGRFNKDLHPTWINKMVDRPHGFRDIFPQTYSDVGIWLSGGFPLGDDATFSMDAFVVNGLMGEDGSGIRGFRGNDREKQSDGARDDNKAVGGRLGFVLPNQHLDFGGSVYTGNSADLSTQDLTLTFFGVDAHYFYEGLSIRAEFITADQEATGGDLRKKGGYLQAAYQANRNWEPVVRFSVRDMPGESSDQSRFSLGLNYYISPAGTVRLNYHINTEETGFESENNVLIAQFVTGF